MGATVDEVAQKTAFSGAVRVDVGGTTVLAKAYGEAHRGWGIPNTVDTRFGIASGSKGFTALAVLTLVQDGLLELSMPVRSVLGADLPLIHERVTLEHLLAHRSGIGDYLDESAHAIDDYVLPVPVHELASTEQYLAVLDGHPMVFAPGERFSYCNGGYVVLALVAERASGVPFHELVVERVCKAAGMQDAAFLRSDELPGRAAVGYLASGDDLRSNVFHLPVRGSGDGGIYATLADLSAFWPALFAGRIVHPSMVAEVMRPRGALPSGSMRYGLGFWLHASSEVVMLEGSDAGVSFRSVHDPSVPRTHTVVSNTSEGAWPLARALDGLD